MDTEKQQNLFKGEYIEEKLRIYFLQNGYHVTRGVKYNYEKNEITDIDLLLYGRISILKRERTNVDIKNKKSPKAFERILWTKGAQELLKFDSCIVATSDKKESVRRYANLHNISLLDGNFLQKLNYQLTDRISEEDMLTYLQTHKSYKTFDGRTWKELYEQSKSRLLNEMDFSGYNTNLIYLRYFFNKLFEPHKREGALRVLYVFMSHNLLTLDYILKDVAFLEPQQRKNILGNGLKFGNLGEDGIDRTIDIAIKISASRYTHSQIKNIINEADQNILILKDYFAKQEIIKNVFKWSIEFEKLAFSTKLNSPDNLNSDLKGIMAMFLDYFGINRVDFFKLI